MSEIGAFELSNRLWSERFSCAAPERISFSGSFETSARQKDESTACNRCQTEEASEE
jgi:hypothetical protein